MPVPPSEQPSVLIKEINEEINERTLPASGKSTGY